MLRRVFILHDLSQEKSEDSYLYFHFIQSITYFSNIHNCPLLCAQLLMLFHVTQSVLSISLLLMFLSSKILMSTTRTYGKRLSSSFCTWIPDCDSHISALLNLFLSSEPGICLQQLSLYWGILTKLLPQFPLTFIHTERLMLLFIPQLLTIVVLIGMVFVII